MVRGSLTIDLIEAKLTRNVQIIGKMDVFVKFTHGSAKHKSPILDNIGMEPKWQNCKFDFLIKGYHEEIEMGVFDKNPLRNRPVGDCKLSVDYLIKDPGRSLW